MHPTLARFLNPKAANDTLLRAERGEPLDEAERALVRAAQRSPEQRRLLRGGKTRGATEAQHAVLYLAVHAAAESVRQDAAFQSPLEAARQALSAAGGASDAVDGALASLLSEEAFGYDDGVDEFDAHFFEETLQSLPKLLALTPERIAALRAELLLGLPAPQRAAAERAFTALLEVAWTEGREPVNPEHLAEAEERLGGSAERDALREVLQLLHRHGLVGPKRLERLQRLLGA